MSANSVANSEGKTGPIGRLIGGRFAVKSEVSEDPTGIVLSAVDEKTGKRVALRLLAKGLLGQAGMSMLREECRKAAALSHVHIADTYGVGTDASGTPFVASEWIEGQTLGQLAEQRREHISLEVSFEIISRVCDALHCAHAAGITHGALRPSSVWLDSLGQIKVSDFGVSHTVVRSAGAASLGQIEQSYLAPEVRAGDAPRLPADIFGLGTLMYLLLTGRSPTERFMPPSQVHPEASETLDQVLVACLAANPEARFSSPEELRTALHPWMATQSKVDFAAEFGVSDDESVSSVPNPKPKKADAPSSGTTRNSGPSSPEADLKALAKSISEDGSPRWMIAKDRLDHGPFSGRELVKMILSGEVRAEHGLTNMDTGARQTVGEAADFRGFVEQFRLSSAAQAQQAALVSAERKERRSKFAIVVGASVVLALFGAGIFRYVLTRGESEETALARNDQAALYESGEVEITGNANVLPTSGRRGQGKRASRQGTRRKKGRLSYEEAMNEVVEFGDVTKSGGGGQLSGAQVSSVMNRHINSLFSCVGQELRRGKQLSNVQIDLAIASDGSVLGASPRQGSPAFKSCISAKVQSIRFPSFGAPRMGARYGFSVQ